MSNWPTDADVATATTTGRSGHERNSNEDINQTHQVYRTVASPSDAIGINRMPLLLMDKWR